MEQLGKRLFSWASILEPNTREQAEMTARVPVVANIWAADGQEAIGKLTRALERAGFIPFDPEREADVFEAEQDPETVSGLPGEDAGHGRSGHLGR